MSESMNLYETLKKGTYIIAEMSANHAGSLAHAKEIIHAAKESGADCVKIQTYTADTLTIDCNNDYFNLTEGTWKGENLYSLYQKAYTPWEWQLELKQTADAIGIDFFSTPFDVTAVDFLEEIDLEFYKIASFELIDLPLIRYVASKGKPIIISTGMANLGEIQDAVDAIRQTGNNQLALLKCSSSYPAIPKDLNLKTIESMQQVFGVPIGLSDHSMGTVAAVVAVSLGASIIEKHFCLSRDLENPDSSFSMEPAEFRQMVLDIRQAEIAIGKVNYQVTDSEISDRRNRRSLFVVKDMKKGEKITAENIRSIRPGHGLSPKYYEEVLGQAAIVDIERGTPLHFDLIGRM